MIRPILLTAALMLAGTAAFAQKTFRLETTPRALTVRPGETARYEVQVVPVNGYGATVNLHVLFPTLGGGAIFTSPALLNAPYTGGATFSVLATPQHAGTHPVIVEGWNGALFVRDTVTLTVDASAEMRGWTIYNTTSSRIPSNVINDIEPDRIGGVWLATRNGIAHFTGTDWSLWPFDSTLPEGSDGHSYNPNVTAIAVDSSGAVWATGTGVILYNATGAWRVFSRTDESLPLSGSTEFTDIAVAPDQTVYAVHRNGVLRYDGSTWQPMSGAPGNGTRVSINHEGAIDIVNGGAVSRFDGEFWSLYPTAGLGMQGTLYDETFDDSGDRWYIGSGGIDHDDDGELRHYGLARYIDVHRATYTAVDFARDGVLWVGSTNGLARVVDNEWTLFGMNNSGLPHTHVTDVLVHRDGRIWIATNGGGLAVLDYDRASGVSEPAMPGVASVHPNPARDRFVVRAPGGFTATLVDMLGRRLRSIEGRDALAIDAANLPAGRYLLRIERDGTVESLAVIIAP